MCMVISTNTGRVYRPKDCERLIVYLKDLNLPKPDKWGTCQLITFLQQVLWFYILAVVCLISEYIYNFIMVLLILSELDIDELMI